jgi:hypothetical protein
VSASTGDGGIIAMDKPAAINLGCGIPATVGNSFLRASVQREFSF